MNTESLITPPSESMAAFHAACASSGLGTVHTSFSLKPASGQLSSLNPNIQVTPNESKYGHLATEFRNAIEAPQGYTIVEGDYRSFHVLTLAYEAGCPDYLRLARLDTHSFLAANLLNLPGCRSCLALPDDELAAYLSVVKKNHETVRNKQAKPGVLGYGFGMGFRTLYNNNQDAFQNEEQAKYVIDMFNDCFPLLKAYRSNTPELAFRNFRLVSKFGCPRWFMQVKEWNPESMSWKHGKDWEKSIAFKPANHAFCVIKLAKLRLRALGLADKYNLVNNVHDALIFIPPDHLLEDCIYNVRAEMQRPISTILAPDGSPFWCEVEFKYGKKWDKKSMKDFKFSSPLDPLSLQTFNFTPAGGIC